jgi:cell division protein FtsA
MFRPSHTIVGLEIGTSKVCAIVGEMSAEGALNIIGIGQARSRGVRKGEITDPQTVEEDIRHAIAEAEQTADVEIRSVYLGVTGSHIRGFVNRGFHPVVAEDREVSAEDVESVVKNAKAINLPPENTVIHSIRQHFVLDGQEGIEKPVTMVGARLEVDLHVIHGNFNRLQNPIRVVKGLQLEVESIVFNGLGSALSLLTSEQKELGALVIDFGAGTTEYAVYADGIIKHAGVLAIGGDHVTNDLAYGLKVSQGRAESLKKEHGAAVVGEVPEDEIIQLTSDHGLPVKSVSRLNLLRIMSMRIEEIFELIAEDLDHAGLLNYIRAGVFVAGGGANIRGLRELGERVFRLPLTVGRACAVAGLPSQLQQPEFVTAIGLVKFGSLQQRVRPAGWSFGNLIKNPFSGMFARR